MAVQSLSVAKGLGTQGTPMFEGLEDSGTETWIRGSVVIPNAQRIAEAATEPVDNILGIAVDPATGTTDTIRNYVPALPNLVFEGNIGTTVSAGDIAAADRLALYPLALSGTDWFVDKTDNTNPCVRVVGFKDPIGTTNGRVYFMFLSDATAYAN